MLFPHLWRYMEGCDVYYDRRVRKRLNLKMRNGLYDQCAYLVRSPAVGAYVRVLGVDLNFKRAPEDLMEKFVDCLVLLPHLWSLKIYSVSNVGSFTQGFEQKRPRFLSIGHLGIKNEWAKFIETCPNVESVQFTSGLSRSGAKILSSCGKELHKLKRIIGVADDSVEEVVQGCQGLREIQIRGMIRLFDEPITQITVADHLRPLKQLAIVTISLTIDLVHPGGYPTQPDLLYGEKTEGNLKAWKEQLIQVLRDSPSERRKFLKWRVCRRYRECGGLQHIGVIEENGESEVFPETSL